VHSCIQGGKIVRQKKGHKNFGAPLTPTNRSQDLHPEQNDGLLTTVFSQRKSSTRLWGRAANGNYTTTPKVSATFQTYEPPFTPIVVRYWNMTGPPQSHPFPIQLQRQASKIPTIPWVKHGNTNITPPVSWKPIPPSQPPTHNAPHPPADSRTTPHTPARPTPGCGDENTPPDANESM